MQTSARRAGQPRIDFLHIEAAHPLRWAAIYIAVAAAAMVLSEIWPWGFAS
jgi:hypothetical protein